MAVALQACPEKQAMKRPPAIDIASWSSDVAEWKFILSPHPFRKWSMSDRSRVDDHEPPRSLAHDELSRPSSSASAPIAASAGQPLCATSPTNEYTNT